MNYPNTDHEDARPSALVAVFATRDYAHRAIERLHDEGFHNTWLGITEPLQDDGYSTNSNNVTGTRVESDNAFARFFGAGDTTLHDALIKHGVSEADAAKLDDTLPAHSAIVTVDGSNHPELAAQLIAECDGEMVSSLGAKSLYDSYADDRTMGSIPRDRLDGLGDYHGGEKLGEERRIQLREERLNVDKKRERFGEATVSTHVTAHKTEIDVPVMHEEFYVERRPAGASTGDAGEIGRDQRIVVPLERERVVVSKQTIATEDVLVGQRRVEDTQHVSETLRKEELDIDDDVSEKTDRNESVRSNSKM